MNQDKKIQEEQPTLESKTNLFIFSENILNFFKNVPLIPKIILFFSIFFYLFSLLIDFIFPPLIIGKYIEYTSLNLFSFSIK